MGAPGSRMSRTKPNPSFSVRDTLELPGRAERPSGTVTSEPGEPGSRSGSLTSTDSGSGPRAAPEERAEGSQPATQRFSVICSEDFDQELVVQPLRVKRRRRRKTGTPASPVAERQRSLKTRVSCWVELFTRHGRGPVRLRCGAGLRAQHPARWVCSARFPALRENCGLSRVPEMTGVSTWFVFSVGYVTRGEI